MTASGDNDVGGGNNGRRGEDDEPFSVADGAGAEAQVAFDAAAVQASLFSASPSPSSVFSSSASSSSLEQDETTCAGGAVADGDGNAERGKGDARNGGAPISFSSSKVDRFNFAYPVLRVSPAFGEGMRRYVEGGGGGCGDDDDDGGDDECRRRLVARVEWGDYRYCESSALEGEDDDDKVKESPAVAAELTVHGLGRRPGYRLLDSARISIVVGPRSPEEKGPPEALPPEELSVSWDAAREGSDYPEYVVELRITVPAKTKSKMDPTAEDDRGEDRGGGGDRSRKVVLRRTLHVLPPPGPELEYDLEEVLWAPELFKNGDGTDDKTAVEAIADIGAVSKKEDRASPSVKPIRTAPRDIKEKNEKRGRQRRRRRRRPKRRGFGLELETVRLPPDADAGYFTPRDEFYAAVRRARDAATSASSSTTKARKEGERCWDRLLLWDVGHDPQVENAAPHVRAELYRRLMQSRVASQRISSDGTGDGNSGVGNRSRSLESLILGGKEPLPEEVLAMGDLPPDPDDIGWKRSLASPEWKSPPPPNELYYTFPSGSGGDDDDSRSDDDSNGDDDSPDSHKDHDEVENDDDDSDDAAADREICLLLDGVLKNPSSRFGPVLCPTVSDIGQSASSVHVHVNVLNSAAWPRPLPKDSWSQRYDLERTQSLLGVVLGWIRFDGVIRQFGKPWMWRDRSLAPMHASGPEFLWREGPAWRQGATVLQREEERKGKGMNMYNVPAFFRHVFEAYRAGISSESTGNGRSSSSLLFDSVFDHTVIVNTLFRDCSLNLLALRKYGTVEFRRMHATLNSDFVSAWTRFCAGFVERFGNVRVGAYDEFVRPFLGSEDEEDDVVRDWEEGLERLIDAQNEATIEDLVEIMAGGGGEGDTRAVVVPRSAFDVLLAGGGMGAVAGKRVRKSVRRKF